MRRITKLGFMLIMMAVLTFALSSLVMAQTFHGTGLICNKCHTMHFSQDGDALDVDGPYPHLLLEANTTDLCLVCHAEPTVYTGAPEVLSAAGDPAIALAGGDYYSSATSTGKGHNPGYEEGGAVATDWTSAMPQDDLMADPLLPPGGVTLGKWDCVSCHAPHRGDISDDYGTAAVFRMLWSKPAKQAIANTAGSTFDAFGNTAQTELLQGDLSGTFTWANDESDTNHTAYRANVSEWCGQCHGANFHNTTDPGDWLRHPSGFALPTDPHTPDYVANYNDTGSAQGGGFDAMVPIAEPDAVLTTGTYSATEDSTVMCLTCHRSHAAATYDYSTDPVGYATDTDDMTRWDMTAASGGKTNCNKCHQKGS